MTARINSIFALTAVASVLVLGAAFRASAASFDCASATQPVEKLICSDPLLSTLDEQLASSYATASAGLDSAGVSLLKSSQRAWLKGLRATCKADAPDAAACLQTAYRDRIEELSRKLTVLGPYVLTIATRSWTETLAEDCGQDPLQRSLSFPRFLEPLSTDQRNWNAEIAASVERDVNDWLSGDMLCTTEFSYDVTATAAERGFISMRTDVVWMGATHSWSSTSTENRLIASGKNLAAEDIFDSSKPWREELARIATEKMLPDARYPFKAGSITDLVDDVGSWEVSPEMLIVHVDFYQMSGGWSGTGTAEIPWKELKTFLRPDLPLALKLD